MTDSQKLDLLLQKMTAMETDISELKADVSVLREDVSVLKEDVSGLKTDVAVLKEDVSGLKEDVRRLDNRMDILEYKENRTHRKLDDLILDVKVAKRVIQKDIAKLREYAETALKVLELREMLTMTV